MRGKHTQKVYDRIVEDAIDTKRKELQKLSKEKIIEIAIGYCEQAESLPCNPIKFEKELEKAEKGDRRQQSEGRTKQNEM